MKLTNFKTILLTIIACFWIAGINAQVTIGSNIEPIGGALLDLKEFPVTDYKSDGISNSQKGLNLPRVALQALDKLEPCAITNGTNSEAHEGLTVYNTTEGSEQTPISSLTAGIYYWNGESWIRMVTEFPQTTLNLLNLKSTVTSTLFDATTNSNWGVELPFDDIVIPETGSYTFTFRLYGGILGIETINELVRGVYYLSLHSRARNAEPVTAIMKDVAEINIYIFRNSQQKDEDNTSPKATYSISLGGRFEKDQVITFKLAHRKGIGSAGYYPWSLVASIFTNDEAIAKDPARTSLIWWKL